MSTFVQNHSLELEIQRSPYVVSAGEDPSGSEVTIRIEGTDLLSVWRELLQRLPSDTYHALEGALKERYVDEVKT